MKKKLMALAAVAILAVSAVALPQAAEARGGRIAAGVAAGLIGGAIIGGALASPGYYYGPGSAITAVRPMSLTTTASGSGSASGTAMAGGFVGCGFAAKTRSSSLQTGSGSTGPDAILTLGLKKPFFQPRA